MRAIQVSKTGPVSVLDLKTISKPSINPSQLLIKVKYSGINFIDTYHRTGLYPLALPFIPGREGSGIVEQVGTNVTGFNVGDVVCFTGTQTYAEYTPVNPEFCLKVPVGYELLSCGMLLQGLTALTLTTLVHKVTKGETVLIHVFIVD
jgi:NADPH2:quinone reductase